MQTSVVFVRIALVTWQLAPPFGMGGVSRYVYVLAKHLQSRGNRVTIFHSFGHDESATDDEFETVRIDVSRIPVIRVFQYARRLRKEVACREFDIIHAHAPQLAWGLADTSQLALTVHTTSAGEGTGLLRSGFQSISSLVQYFLFVSISRAMEISAIRRAALIMTVNSLMSEELSRTSGHPSNSIITVEPATDHTSELRHDKALARKALGIGEDSFVALFVGRLDGRKNPIVLLEGFGQITGKSKLNPMLIYCGEGQLRRDLERRVKKLGLENNVQILGRVREDTLSLAYSAADVYVLPSEVEGFPATLLECRSYGVPAIVGPFIGAHRIVTETETGIVLEKVSPQAVSDALLYLMERREVVQRMSSNAIQLSNSSSTWEDVVRKTLDAYQRITRTKVD